jgi:hypothetical protein
MTRRRRKSAYTVEDTRKDWRDPNMRVSTKWGGEVTPHEATINSAIVINRQSFMPLADWRNDPLYFAARKRK